MKSRIQILNELAYKWSRNDPSGLPIDDFKEWLIYYDYEATLRLVYIAMQEYAKPIKKQCLTLQPGDVEQWLKDNENEHIKDDIGLTGQYNVSVKDIVDLVIDLS